MTYVQISHISGTQKYLANIISLNPAELTPEQIMQITRPRYIVVVTIQLNIDPQVKKEPKEFSCLAR
jgi:hypothetical protein